jgi:hypothetical protein
MYTIGPFDAPGFEAASWGFGVQDGKVGRKGGGLGIREAAGELVVVIGVLIDPGVPGRVIPGANGAEPPGGTEELRCMLLRPP